MTECLALVFDRRLTGQYLLSGVYLKYLTVIIHVDHEHLMCPPFDKQLNVLEPCQNRTGRCHRSSSDFIPTRNAIFSGMSTLGDCAAGLSYPTETLHWSGSHVVSQCML